VDQQHSAQEGPGKTVERGRVQAVVGAYLGEESAAAVEAQWLRCYSKTYLLTAFQTHQATTATRTHGTSALKTISTSSSTRAETAVRLVSAFASSVM
jgi:hypothetical protein